METWVVEMDDSELIEVQAFDESDAMDLAEQIRAEAGDPTWAVGAERPGMQYHDGNEWA